MCTCPIFFVRCEVKINACGVFVHWKWLGMIRLCGASTCCTYQSPHKYICGRADGRMDGWTDWFPQMYLCIFWLVRCNTCLWVPPSEWLKTLWSVSIHRFVRCKYWTIVSCSNQIVVSCKNWNILSCQKWKWMSHQQLRSFTDGDHS